MIKDLDINDEEQLRYYRQYFAPGGSGPLGMMRIICQLIDAIAEDKGFDLSEKKDEQL